MKTSKLGKIPERCDEKKETETQARKLPKIPGRCKETDTRKAEWASKLPKNPKDTDAETNDNRQHHEHKQTWDDSGSYNEEQEVELQARKLQKIPNGCKETYPRKADWAPKFRKNPEDADVEKQRYYKNIMDASKLGKIPDGVTKNKKNASTQASQDSEKVAKKQTNKMQTWQANFRRIRKIPMQKNINIMRTS